MSGVKNFQRELFFDFDIEKNTNTCKIEECKKVLKGNLVANLRRHISSCHKALAFSINLIDSNDNALPSGEKKRKKSDYNKSEIKKACVSLCTRRGMPFAYFGYEELIYLIEPLLTKYDLTINSKNITNNIKEAATLIQQKISKDLQGKLFALKVDLASRSGRHILGINAQYIRESEVKVVTLGMVEVSISQTSANIKREILDLLEKFGLLLVQVVCITTDNGANMLKSSKLLQIEQQNILDVQQEPNPDESVSDSEDDVEIETNNDVIDTAVGVALDSILVPVRCAAHSFQLAVLDVIK